MKPFCDSDFNRLLDLHQLNDFGALWDLENKLVEDPNSRRGGRNGVCHLCLSDAEGIAHNFFLKRQQNNLIHCGFLLQKKPTLYREFRSILFCKKRNLPCIDVVYYGERKYAATGKGKKGLDYQAILITPALRNYTPFSEIISNWEELAKPVRHRYLHEIASLIAGFHQNRLSHNNGLHPNQLAVNLDSQPPVRLINVERMSFQFRKTQKCAAELATFDEVEFFLGRYCHHHPSALPTEN